jgi:SAM-dependent methyltransferase
MATNSRRTSVGHFFERAILAVRRRFATSNSSKAASYFNLPVKLVSGQWRTNERLIELPFVFQILHSESQGKRALEFGCTRSWLALQLAAWGYDVTAVDLRPYPLSHPQLTVHQMNVLNLRDDEGFDLITAVSVIEHIGVGYYGETARSDDLPLTVEKLTSLLKVGGRLIVTVPVGKPHQDDFLRSFLPDEIEELFGQRNLQLIAERYFMRDSRGAWCPADRGLVALVDNSTEKRGPTGVNGVGCFAWVMIAGA